MMDGGQQHQTRNYIGIAGCLIALLGMALPYVDAWIVRASLFSLLADFAAFAIPLVLLALVCAVILCVQGNHQVRWIGVVLLLLLLAITFLDDENIVEDVSDLLGSGFWVMVIGLVIIILSPSFSLGNILSNTSPTSRPSSKPAAPNASSDYALQWTCKRCGRKNTGNGNFCSSCGEQNPTKLFCPNCGKPVAVGDVFCMYCHTKLSKDLDGSTTVGDNSSPVIKTPARGNFTRYQGFWQWYVNSARIPQWELTISTVFSTSFVFSLMHKNGFAIPLQTASVTGENSAEFETKDGTNISGVFSFKDDMILLLISRSEETLLPAGTELTFTTHSDRRAL